MGTRPEKQSINYGEGDYSMDRMAAIRRLAEEQEALIAAHTYQTPEIQDVADIVGDSYALAKRLPTARPGPCICAASGSWRRG